MRIVYSQEAVQLEDGEQFRNPRFFGNVIPDAEHVTIFGDWPKIVAAYQAVGVPVEVMGVPKREAPANPDPFGADAPGTYLCGSEDEIPDIPDGWRDLPWQDLRALAQKCGAPWAINKEQAIGVIEAVEARMNSYSGEPPMVSP